MAGGFEFPEEYLARTVVVVPNAPELGVGEFAPPADPDPVAGHPGFLALLDELRRLHLKKASDYGRGVDPLANCRASEEFGIPAWKGVLVRLNDKMHRLKSFCLNGSLANEGVKDSLLDAAAYALIALTLYRESQAGEMPAGTCGSQLS